ncbi:MAG: hypothetical protein ACEPOV_09900 [Hyphomicrobiales bacterium]
MDQFRIKSKITHNIQSISAINDIMNKAGRKSSHIEIDLLMEKARDLYELLVQLKTDIIDQDIIEQHKSTTPKPQAKSNTTKSDYPQNRTNVQEEDSHKWMTRTPIEEVKIPENKEKQEVVNPAPPKSQPIPRRETSYNEVKPTPSSNIPHKTTQERPTVQKPSQEVRPQYSNRDYSSERNTNTTRNVEEQRRVQGQPDKQANHSLFDRQSEVKQSNTEDNESKVIQRNFTPKYPENNTYKQFRQPEANKQVEEKNEEEQNTHFELESKESIASIADRFFQQKDNSIAAKFQNESVKSLKTAIGLNEKFLFIRELFNGKPNEYEKFISELDEFMSYNGAMTYFSEMKIRYQWHTESEAVVKLVELIENKFGE